MKALKIFEPKILKIVDIEEPKIVDKNDVKIKTMTTGICGSDVSMYAGTNTMVVYPRIFGHEMAGEVVEVGSSVENLKVGDHVTVDPVNNCGYCHACREGRPNICYNLKVRGVQGEGFNAEYIVVPKDAVYKLSSSIPWEEACLIEPYTIGFNATSRAGLKPADTLLILGAGTIGQTTLRTALMMGARVIISDIDDEKLETAKNQGAFLTINPARDDLKKIIEENTEGFGPNVVIDAVCIPETVEQSIELAAPGGRVVTLGFSETPSKIQQKHITAKELDIRGSRLNNRKFASVIKSLEDKKINFDDMISHVIDFKDAKDAFEIMLDANTPKKKIVLKYY
ncbi:zinc-binding alcohol dehydrogenase family protein [Miniphocaeibacter halophilus]|uniref:Zinc-binding alcohol dehydrogenase family protein n=1 Tax=Miniphocaeibacter halophilus TaxID=2931922 RepID=A0AC61MQX2_9FIRM|nr:zinc-binding alcohol dehydrogenase family protein [Miniphocaeibacter halophilus]QQK07989.1 zinc-binding alcohol dehydrogenase family protein [Miniphocaeibacter halophilus]